MIERESLANWQVNASVGLQDCRKSETPLAIQRFFMQSNTYLNDFPQP
jgi:hypothetical protein